MTICIGIKCIDGLVFSSESQETREDFNVKRLNSQKLYLLEGSKSIVATAGTAAFCDKARAYVEKRIAHETNLNIVDEFETGVTLLAHNYIVKRIRLFYDDKIQGPDLKDFENWTMPKVNIAMLLGSQEDNSFSLYTLFPEGFAQKEQDFSAIGSGGSSDLAEYLLGKLYYKSMDVKQGLLLAAFVVQEVKKINPGCGGEIQLAAMTENICTIVPPDMRKRICERAAQISERMDAALRGVPIKPVDKKEQKKKGKATKKRLIK